MKNLIDSHRYNLVRLDWLKRATKKENWAKVAEFYPWEMLDQTIPMKKEIEIKYDEMFDSYTEDATLESLKRSLEKADEKVTFPLT